MHCAMDTNNRCDFFYFRSHYCYLGSFNQVGGIGVHYCCDTITIRMNKCKNFFLLLQLILIKWQLNVTPKKFPDKGVFPFENGVKNGFFP